MGIGYSKQDLFKAVFRRNVTKVRDILENRGADIPDLMAIKEGRFTPYGSVL